MLNNVPYIHPLPKATHGINCLFELHVINYGHKILKKSGSVDQVDDNLTKEF